jgi:hypothetical protein
MGNSNSHDVSYKNNGDCYYKINGVLKRITKIENNIVTYLDYITNIYEVRSYKKIKMNAWKHVENSFFMSRDFEWEYQGVKYTTTNKSLSWERDEFHNYVSFVFHNGGIWKAHNSGNYYPRVFLEREKFINPIRKVLFEKDVSNSEAFKNKLKFAPKTTKWTDIKYCRHFEKIR